LPYKYGTIKFKETQNSINNKKTIPSIPSMSMYTKKIKATTTLIAPAIQNDIYIDVAQMFKANFAEQFLHILFDPNTANPQELNVNEDGCSPHFGQLEKLILIIT
jgi:hypothetical protein